MPSFFGIGPQELIILLGGVVCLAGSIGAVVLILTLTRDRPGRKED